MEYEPIQGRSTYAGKTILHANPACARAQRCRLVVRTLVPGIRQRVDLARSNEPFTSIMHVVDLQHADRYRISHCSELSLIYIHGYLRGHGAVMVRSTDRERYRLGIPVNHHGAVIGLGRASEVVAIGTLILQRIALPFLWHQLLFSGQTSAPLATYNAVIERCL